MARSTTAILTLHGFQVILGRHGSFNRGDFPFKNSLVAFPVAEIFGRVTGRGRLLLS